MKKDISKEFLDEYDVRRKEFEEILEQITALLRLRLGQLAARTGTRGMLVDSRIKRPAKIWGNAAKLGLPPAEIFSQTEDLLGVRIVCNNLSDIEPIVQMIQTDCSGLKVLEVKDMVSSPTSAGYRATHVRTEFIDWSFRITNKTPCEIQVRTLAQDTWARLSRDDLYGNRVPPSIQRLSRTLSAQLSTIDDIAQLIRDELNRFPILAQEISPSDPVAPQRLALLYKQRFGEEIYEWSLIEWIENLEEAEAKTINDVMMLLDDIKSRSSLDKISQRIRGFPLEDLEWVVYSAAIAAESSRTKGIKAVQRRIQNEWDEIVATARRDILSSMPDSLEEFVIMLRNGSIPSDALAELGGAERCYRCGAHIIRPTQAAEGVLEYYGFPDSDVDLESLMWDHEQAESVDYGGVCQCCGHQMSKDD